MRHPARHALSISLTCGLAGCAAWVAPLSETRIDNDHGHRTLGAKVEDEAIEYKALVNLGRQPSLPAESCISVTSWNGQVLLVGKVPDDKSRSLAADTVSALRHVQQVHNELATGACAGTAATLGNALTTAGVKVKLLLAPDVPARRVKVVTEDGTLYLMGLLSRNEAEAVVQTVQDAWGVQKIVKIFEYLDD